MFYIFSFVSVVVILAPLFTTTSAQKKWVWGDGRRSAAGAEEFPQGDHSIARPVLSISNADGGKRIPLFQAADNPRTDAKFFR